MGHTVMRRLGLAVVAGAILAASACGSSSSETPAPSSGTATPLSLQASEYSFGGLPSTVSAGLVNLQLHNTGKEAHEAQLLTIDSGHTGDELIKVASAPNSPPPTWVHGAGGPAATVAGGQTSVSQVLTPGTYYFLCLIPGADNVPHTAKGMHTTLTVTGSSGRALPPSADTTVVAKEYSFEAPPTLKVGTTTIGVRNDGPRQLHEWGLIKLAPGFTVDKLKAALASNGPPPPGPPPFTEMGGVAAYDRGGTATFTADLQSGNSYAFICFVPDHEGGPPHAAKGMIRGFTAG
ncbi:MAG: hypothetical protein ABR564_00960 [Candidatus Dormibacteria bacterium]